MAKVRHFAKCSWKKLQMYYYQPALLFFKNSYTFIEKSSFFASACILLQCTSFQHLCKWAKKVYLEREERQQICCSIQCHCKISLLILVAFSFFTKGKKQKDGVNWVENEKMSLRICDKKQYFLLLPSIHLILRFLGVGMVRQKLE